MSRAGCWAKGLIPGWAKGGAGSGFTSGEHPDPGEGMHCTWTNDPAQVGSWTEEVQTKGSETT